MTDIERAEKYANSNGFGSDYNNITSSEANEEIKKAVLYGLTEGRKEKWHNLRKNPKDLPNGYGAVLNQEGKTTIYDPSRGFLGLDGVEVIAWCEIPTFTEWNENCFDIKQ